MRTNGVIRFSYNWNEKLNGKSFTTIRRQSDKYFQGAIHSVMLKEKSGWVTSYQNAEIIDVKVLTLSQIIENEWICRLDTGYSASETKGILMRMYPDVKPDTKFCFVLYSFIGEK